MSFFNRLLIDFQDRDGVLRVTGEEWLVKKVGAYLPGAYEEVVDVVNAIVLTEKVGIICPYPLFYTILHNITLRHTASCYTTLHYTTLHYNIITPH